MKNLFLDVETALGDRWERIAPLGALQKDRLVDKEIAIRHRRHLLPEYYRVIVEVVAIVLIDQLPIDGLNPDVDEVLDVLGLFQLLLVDLGAALVLFEQGFTLHV